MTNRIVNRIIDTESIKSAAQEWGWAYASLFSLQSLAYTATVLWFGITDPPSEEFYPAFIAILRDIGIAGLAAVVITTTILEGAQSITMIISATFLKPRERRIREEGREEGREKGREEGHEEGFVEGREKGIVEGRAEGRAEASQTFDLERAAWQAWYQRYELARERGEEPPPPPFFNSGDNGQSAG